MARYPRLVDIAWEVVNAFMKDWQAAPYSWANEIDIQVEIASRLSTVFRLVGIGPVRANNRQDALVGLEMVQDWGRVACEPALALGPRRGLCKPDIVILKNVPKPDSPPPTREFPAHWACEIKYGRKPNSDRDFQKIRRLVDLRIVDYGCCLAVVRARASNGNGIKWTHEKGGKVWQCQALLPAAK